MTDREARARDALELASLDSEGLTDLLHALARDSLAGLEREATLREAITAALHPVIPDLVKGWENICDCELCEQLRAALAAAGEPA